MNSDERLARVYLTTVDTLDDDSLRQLVDRNGLVRTAELVADAGARPGDWERAACLALDRARRYGVRLLTPGDREWPTAAREPFGLWVPADTPARSVGLARRLVRRIVIARLTRPAPASLSGGGCR